ncbi:hypothetical protein MYX82_07955 [Acidobacteria bacterium AH-259-D05]|nr:hypothetical protein [Acidobacteria bacterium AH-259-D05]
MSQNSKDERKLYSGRVVGDGEWIFFGTLVGGLAGLYVLAYLAILSGRRLAPVVRAPDAG